MKVSSILVISVIIKPHNRVIFRNIFSLNMKVSSILVISVIIKPHSRVNLRDIFSVSTKLLLYKLQCFFPVFIIVVSSLFYEIHKYISTFLVGTSVPPWYLHLKLGFFQ